MKGSFTSPEKFTILLLFKLLLLIQAGVWAQCPPKVTVYSPYPAPGVNYPAASSGLKDVFNVIPKTSSSYNYTHTFVFTAMGNFTIKFGDGTPDFSHSGAPLTSFAHTYTTQGVFVYEIINQDCTSGTGSVTGRILNGKDTEPLILGAGFPPTDNFCVPYALTFQNNSLGMSPFFEYDWDFGDTPATTYDTTLTLNNGVGTISHIYPKAYSKCGIYVKFRVRKILPGSNFVPFIQTGGPYNFLNLDVPKVNKAEFILCERGIAQDVELVDASVLNCLATDSRTIRWDIMEEPLGKSLTKVSGTLGAELSYAVAANKKVRVKVPANALKGDEYKLRLIISNQCGRDTTFSYIKIVAPEKPTFTLTNNSVCPGKSLSFKNTSADRTNVYYNYYWDVYNEAGSKVSTLQSGNENVEIPFKLPGRYMLYLRARITSYTIVAPAPYCESISDPQEITVNDNVVAQITLPKDTFCVKSENAMATSVLLSNTSINETTSTKYKWYVSTAGGDTLTFGNTPYSLLKNTTFNPSTPGRFIVKLEAFDVVNACSKTFDLDTFFVFNQPKALLKAINACAGAEVILRDSSKVFDTANKGFPTDVDNMKINVDFRDGTPFYSYLKNDNGICGVGTDLFTTSKIGCTRLIRHVYAVPGDYWVRFTIQNSEKAKYYCEAVDSVLVKVYPLTSPTFIRTSDGCAPLKVQLVNNTSTSVGTFVWNINGEDVKKNFLNSLDTVFSVAGDYKVVLKVINEKGCASSSAAQTVKVFPAPQFQISSNYTTFSSKCSPLNLKFTADLGTTNPSLIESASWEYFEENTLIATETITDVTNATALEKSRKFVNTSFAQKKFSARLTVKLKTGGCASFKETEFVIDPRPMVDFLMDQSSGCSPLSVKFSIDAANVNASTQYTWSFPGGSQLTSNSPQPPVITFVNKGSEPVTKVVRLTTITQQGCSDFMEKTITIFPETNPSFSILNNRKICSGDALQFENKSTGGVALKYVWNWGDGTPNDTTISTTGVISHRFENLTTLSDTSYAVKLIAIGNCVVQSEIRSVTVERRLKADFNIVANTSCAPVQVTLLSESDGPVNSFTWKIDGVKQLKRTATLIETLPNTTSDPKEYTITLIVNSRSGCSDTLSKTITINPSVAADFTMKNTGNKNCSPVTYEFTNTSAGMAKKYLWDFGDGKKDTVETKSGVSHTFINPGTSQAVYRITLTPVTDTECGTSKYIDIIVAPSTLADFIMDSVGCSPLEVHFENRSVKSDILEWDFGNGTIYTGSLPPSQVYFNNGNTPVTTEVKLKSIASGGCENVMVKKLTIYPEPKPSFVVAKPTQTFPESTFSIENTSPEGDWNYEWSFGDGETSGSKNPGAHIYKRPGSYNITLKISNLFCEKSFTSGVRIIPLNPVAQFKPDAAKGCRPLTVHFENLSEYADSSRYIWDFGDGMARSKLVNPSFTYYEPGVYTVKLVAANFEGRTDEVIKERLIEVTDIPYATFRQSRTVVHIPSEEIYFTNLSENATSYFWDFGDGSTSTEKNPVYTYQDTGRFTIKMVAMSGNGCSDTTMIERAVLATADGVIKVPNAFTPSLIGSSSRAVSSEGLNDIFYPIVQGVEEIEMNIFNRWGELMYSCKGRVCDGWNGYYKGKLCKQDVYVYNIKARLANGEMVEKVGDVILLN